jgi:hypothetical protein
MASKKTATKRVGAEQYVWIVHRGGGSLAFGSEAGAREAAGIVENTVNVKPLMEKIRFFYDSATTADVQDILKLPIQVTL